MTPDDWATATHPKQLIGHLFACLPGRSASAKPDERFRLFGVACCRRVLGAGDRAALDSLEVYARSGEHDALKKARRFHRPDGNAASRGLSAVDSSDRRARFLAEARSLASSAVWSCT
jgi:hypothetical protein